MQKNGYISVIIPVYNCERYIARCLKSVSGQTYTKLEIILINDGSTDHTAEICRDFAAVDSRIRYIEQQNRGVAYTRKKGVEMALGQYVGFVDADDYIDADFYEKMIFYMADVQLVTSGYIVSERIIFDELPEGIYQSEEKREYLYKNMLLFENKQCQGISSSLFTKLFIAEKLKNVVQKTAMDVSIGEDVDIVFRYILQCDAVYISRVCSYHYELNVVSAMHSVNKKYLSNFNSLYLSLEEEFEKSSYRDILIPKWNKWVWQTIQRDTPRFMGWDFEQDKQRVRYISPYINLLPQKRIVLYGAGVVGRDFYRLSQKIRDADIVLWVDMNWENLQKEGLPVYSTDEIARIDYDYILLAVKERKQADGIRKHLYGLGVEEAVVLWKSPIDTEV